MIEDHLGSRDVARVIYGAIIGLALVVALEDHPPSPGAVAATVVGTALAVGLAEAYSEIVGAEARTRKKVHGESVRVLAIDAAAVTSGPRSRHCSSCRRRRGHGHRTGVHPVEVDRPGADFHLRVRRCPAIRIRVWRGVRHAAAVGAVGSALIALKALVH